MNLKSIWKWITDPNNQRILFFTALVIFVLLYLKGCNDRERLEAKLQMSNNNIVALQDTVRVEKTRSGELQYVKTVLSADLKDLKQLNSDLYKEVKDQKTQVYYISKITAQLNDKIEGWNPGGEHTYDPISGNDMIDWKFDTTGINWSRSISGTTSFKITSSCNGYEVKPIGSKLDNVNYKFSLTTGLKESKTHKGSLEIFINSTYPGMTFTDIQGSIIDPEDFRKYLPAPKPHRWSFGPYFGIGYGITLKQQTQLVPTINIGLGLQYKLFSF